MKKSASSKSKTLMKIPKGATISYEFISYSYELHPKNGYYRVHYKSKLGYVPKKYVKLPTYYLTIGRKV